MWIDRPVGRFRERVAPSWQFESLLQALFLCFRWPVILLCLNLSSCLVYLRVLPCVSVHPLAKVDSNEEAYGQLTSLTMGCCPLSDLQGAFLCMYSCGGNLTSRMRNMWCLIFYMSRAQPPSQWSCYSQNISPQGKNLNCLPQGDPSTSCLISLQTVAHQAPLSM